MTINSSSLTALVSFVLVLSVARVVEGDVYMHNPRGSNDRNCERNVNRNNGNRLFNSQNNNNGGYACPRGVGDETFQNEAGLATFTSVNPATGDTTTFQQNMRMYYYEKSILPIEWTSQHGCGRNSKVACETVIQYACEDTLDPRVDDFWPWTANKGDASTAFRGKQHFRSAGNIAAPRDGVPTDVNDAATDTIPDNEASAIPDTAADRRFGMQESFDYYDVCQRTERNKGLYTADQLVGRNDRRGTRQNPNGNRHGFECPEERDYYPWWAPSPWIDIAVLSDSAGDVICPYSQRGNPKVCTPRCAYYMNRTMNFNKVGYCDVNHATQPVTLKTNSARWRQNTWYNNAAACQAAGFVWYAVSHADNLRLADTDVGSSFVCAHTEHARVNQLGNAAGPVMSESLDPAAAATGTGTATPLLSERVVHGVNANRFLWTVPSIPRAKDPAQYFSPAGADLSGAYKSCVLRIRYNISSADFQAWPKDAVTVSSDRRAGRMVDAANNSRVAFDPRTPLTQDPYVYIGTGDVSGSGSQRADKFLSLKVNTNQYARTFQDRSYVFSIRPLPTVSAAENKETDTPAVDATLMRNNLAAGGKIFNVNVRGKRGNIVQTFPSVEYDFVPNALALSGAGVDMVHFQWTGSDYNPRRGCNDGTGGPPDLNTYFTDANADQNSRADRSNVVFTQHMANNVPRDYLGYPYAASRGFTNATRQLKHDKMILSFAPCADPKLSDMEAGNAACLATVKRLAYLNQQLDGGSLTLRQGRSCLTEKQLNAIPNQNVAENHPLNCAKLNAKPYPYFDGGVMFLRTGAAGFFSFFSSRNNNFSNRQQIGVLCIGAACKAAVQNDTAGGALQDENPSFNGGGLDKSSSGSRQSLSGSVCVTTANGESGATANGGTSCVTAAAINQATGEVQAGHILQAETFSVHQADNDNMGDGNPFGCAVLKFSYSFSDPGSNSVEQQLALAFILLAVGLFVSWLAYFLYNRYRARKEQEGKFRYDTAWQAELAKEMELSKNYKASALGSEVPTATATATAFPARASSNYNNRSVPPPPRDNNGLMSKAFVNPSLSPPRSKSRAATANKGRGDMI